MTEPPKLPTFYDALKRLEPQITAGDDPLVADRTLRFWRAGNLPPAFLILLQYPELIAALAADVDALADPPKTVA